MTTQQQRIIKRREVEYRTGLKRSSIYEKIRTGTFPRPIKLGIRASGWSEVEVDAWLSAQIAKRDAA
jgi:prophage regulatory protein